jgi:hypothetical protein
MQCRHLFRCCRSKYLHPGTHWFVPIQPRPNVVHPLSSKYLFRKYRSCDMLGMPSLFRVRVWLHTVHVLGRLSSKWRRSFPHLQPMRHQQLRGIRWRLILLLVPCI